MTSIPPDSVSDEQTVDLTADLAAVRAAQTPPFDRKRALVVGIVATLVVSGVGLVAYSLAGDVPRGTRVLGVELGGMSRSEAERVLRARVAQRAGEPLKVRLDGRSVQLRPVGIGLRVEVDASVGRAIRSGMRFAGGHDVAPVVRVDRGRLEAGLRGRIPEGRITVRRPGISLVGGAVVPAYPASGLDLDLDAAVEAVKLAWPIGAAAEVPLVTRTPETTRAGVDEMIATLAEPALAAPVTVRVGEKSFRLTPKAIARGLIFRSDSAGRLTPAIDGPGLRAAAAKELATVETPPRSATIAVKGNRPRIVASTAGELVDLDRLAPALLAALPRTTGRTVTATLVRKGPPTTERALAKLGIAERVSTFTTHFTGGRTSPRSRNIITIAEAVDGAVVRPGETFSLNAHTGERDYAAGYHDAPVIVGGHLEPGVGGGASQFTTTLFNAAYYAGLQDVEHKPHSFYFDRYPAVIESTIFYPALDLKFRNTTPYGILIDTATSDDSVTVAMWSTRVYDSVETEYGPRRHRTSPPTVHRPSGPRCLTSSGLPGFTQDAWRVIRKDGREIERQKFSWRYDPEPRFVCGAMP
jgi:vancomycin resistance protein YoaR